MRGIRFRMPEWILLTFFGYVALLSLVFRDRPHLRGQPWVVLLAVAALFCALSLLERGASKKTVEVVRDWLPVVVTFFAFREMEFFLPRDYDSAYELAWIRWDRILLHDWGLRAAIESFGKTLPFYFEFCYLLVYGVAVYGVGLLSGGPRKSIDRFWVVYLLGTLGAYALFPYFPTRPPRYVFPDMEPPLVSTWARHFNLFLLSKATIHVGVFPSAHVSAAFSSAWGMFLAKPARRVWGWVLLIYSVSVAIATIYGRYHYAADALAGFGVSVAAAMCLYTCGVIGDWRGRAGPAHALRFYRFWVLICRRARYCMTWWHRLWRRRQMEEQLEKELRFHLDRNTADLIARGYLPDEARRQARLALGGPEQVKEECRRARGARWLEDLLQDFRYALRALRQRPAFAAVAVCTLALGSGATTIMFSVINGVLLKPLPYPKPGRLVKVEEQTKGITDYRWGDRWAFAYPNFLDCKREIRSLDLAARRYSGGTVTGPGEAEYVDGFQISSGLFAVLGVRPVQGRAFLPEEDRPGAAPVIIISYGLWQRQFGGDPAAIGRPLVFEGQPHTVVGIVPSGFRLGGGEADVFTPLGENTQRFMQNREAHPGINVWARLRPGVTLAEAQAELALVGHHLAEQYPKSNAGRGFVAEPLRPDVGDVRSTLWLVLGAVGLVLLIACGNVACLLLARAISRERELAMRMALGAGRSRLIRQCLTESAVLGLFGGALGVLFAAIGTRPFVVFWPGSLPRADEVTLDWHVLTFALAVSLASGLLFGLAPALRAPARELERALRAGGRSIVGSSRRLHSGFVIAEIAFAVVLLVSAGILGRTLLHLSSLDPGVNIRNVLTARMALSPGTLDNPARTRAAWQDILDRAHRVPGVQSIAMVDTVPMREGDNELGYWTTPAEPPRNQKPLALANSVTPEYLKVMGIPLRKGRFLNEHDRMGNELVVVIDDVLAQHAFAGQEPVGKRLWTDLVPDPLLVVGVVGHVRHWGLAGAIKPTSGRSSTIRLRRCQTSTYIAGPSLCRLLSGPASHP